MVVTVVLVHHQLKSGGDSGSLSQEVWVCNCWLSTFLFFASYHHTGILFLYEWSVSAALPALQSCITQLVYRLSVDH